MITVPEVLKDIIKERPYLEDYLLDGVINHSSLARILLPEVEHRTMKQVSEAAVTVAIKRIQKDLKQSNVNTDTKIGRPDIIVRSNLCEITLQNSETLAKKVNSLIVKVSHNKQYLFVVTQGVFETTIILSNELTEEMSSLAESEIVVSQFKQLAAITLKYQTDIISLPGVYYQVLRPLAMEGVSFTEIASTYSELTLILQQKHVEEAFRLINNSIRQNEK